MSFGALKVHVRRDKQVAALLTPYVRWLLTLVSPEVEKHARITVRVFFGKRGGARRPETRTIFNPLTMSMEEQQGFRVAMGLARIRTRRLDRYANFSGTPEAVNIALAVHIFNEALMESPRRLTSVLVHELAHVYDIFDYAMARSRQARTSADEYDDEVAEAAYKTLSTPAEMERRAHAKERRVMGTLTDSEISERVAPFWDALRMPSAYRWSL